MGTKNNPGKFDCYAKAEPDEPLFVLLARDPAAPVLIYLWTIIRELRGETEEKRAEAHQLIDQMFDWQIAHGIKTEGVGVAVLAGVMDLVRMANAGIEIVKKNKNDPTTDEVMRMLFARTTFDWPEKTPEA